MISLLKYTFSIEWFSVFNGDEIGALDLPYFYETRADLNCSIDLARREQFKHAHQVLRSALECMVIHAYFFSLKMHYDQIQICSIPRLNHQKNGMLQQLVNESILNKSESQEIRDMYYKLSKAIHSHWDFLPYKFEGAKCIDFQDWSQNFSTVARQILIIMVRLSQKAIHKSNITIPGV